MLSLERWRGKIAIVTGASSGIGAKIAAHLVKSGLLVVGLARRVQVMNDLASKLCNETGKLYPVQTDITKEEDILQAFAWVQANLGVVSILINNAGVAQINSLISGGADHWITHINTRVLGLSIATREAIKDMRANGVEGHIIHINGIFGHYFPKQLGLEIIGPAEFAITALTETLRLELNSIGSKIKISSISPGLVDTPLTRTISPDPDILQFAPKLNASDIADAIVYVLSTPPHVQVHELIIRPVGENL